MKFRLFAISLAFGLAGCAALQPIPAPQAAKPLPVPDLNIFTSQSLPKGQNCVFSTSPDLTKAALACRQGCAVTFTGDKAHDVKLECSQ